MFPVVALVLSVLFEGLAIEAHIVTGVILVLTGNLVILETRQLLNSLRTGTKSILGLRDAGRTLFY